jgi:hypothetical protein
MAAEAVAAREAGKLHRGERAGRAPGGGGNDRACTQADGHEADKRQSPRNAARKPHGGGVHLRNSGRQVYGVPARYHALRRAGSPVCGKGRIGRRQANRAESGTNPPGPGTNRRREVAAASRAIAPAPGRLSQSVSSVAGGRSTTPSASTARWGTDPRSRAAPWQVYPGDSAGAIHGGRSVGRAPA